MNHAQARSSAVMGRRRLGLRRRAGRRGPGSEAATRARTRTWTRRPETVIVARLRAAVDSACAAACFGSSATLEERERGSLRSLAGLLVRDVGGDDRQRHERDHAISGKTPMSSIEACPADRRPAALGPRSSATWPTTRPGVPDGRRDRRDRRTRPRSAPAAGGTTRRMRSSAASDECAARRRGASRRQRRARAPGAAGPRRDARLPSAWPASSAWNATASRQHDARSRRRARRRPDRARRADGSQPRPRRRARRGGRGVARRRRAPPAAARARRPDREHADREARAAARAARRERDAADAAAHDARTARRRQPRGCGAAVVGGALERPADAPRGRGESGVVSRACPHTGGDH